MAEAGLNTRAEVLSPAEGGDVAEYFALMKPRVMFLVVFTALVGLVAAPGHMHPVLTVAALLCIAVGAGAAGALNMWYDADIDARMARTSARPIPRGRITADEARAFGTVLAIGSVICLGLMANWVAAGLLALTIAFYVFVYTMWLKRSTPQNIVIGGAAGAVPPMIGWAAATGTVSLESFVLFLIIFMWTPPHFWALALLRVRDYERAGVPMMPVVKGEDETRRQILIYSLILAPLGCVPAVVGLGGGLYTVAAGFLGAFFVMFAYACYSERVGPDAERAAKNLFAYSVLYLFLLFAVLLVEQGFGLGRSSIPLFWTS
ncbi:MAG: heme o synthase [Methyloceanibacter sp.]|jgi:protoheme IX farnesyltransferase|uniref:heme o synthase n=1 Tax=Methyloceanibacter sp. TaxID=1965321 RepID=UPI003C750491